jgi:phospholipase/carboxylesterase
VTKILNYKIQKASQYPNKSGVIFLIHGYGSNYDDLFSFKTYLPKNLSIISLEAPIQIEMGGFAWYSINYNQNFEKWSNNEEAILSIKQIYQTINTLLKKYNLNLDDISLLGFSQGAILSWALGFNYPNLIRRVIALSGYINEDLIDNNNLSFKAFASHGITDPIIPIDWPRNTIKKYIKKDNDNLIFKEYNDGHTVSENNLLDFLTWINKTSII